MNNESRPQHGEEPDASQDGQPMDNRDQDLTLATLEFGRIDTEVNIQRLLGDARFREDASLVLTIGEANTPLIIQLAAHTVIGRESSTTLEADVIDLSPYGAREKGVSRLHAALHRSPRTLAIEDMESSNGTWVNGQRLMPHEPHVLHDGDEIQLAGLVMHVAFQ